jgi:uncharacterized protein
LSRSPIVALLGPRQCGKTTLARLVVPPDSSLYFDLEDPSVALAMENPMTTLSKLTGTVVIDEVQRIPSIFPVLRVLADRSDLPARFLLLGSASPDLSRQASESLAGRVEIIDIQGFDLGEVGESKSETLWFRGGFPRSFLADSNEDSVRWRRNFIRTFLERDLARHGFGINPMSLGRFWTMVSHYHGQIWNGSEIAASLGIAPNTARSYLDALEQTFMIRQLKPWHENLGKRLVKTPKIYFRDSGLFHALQAIDTPESLLTHPKLGASWEGFAMEIALHALKPLDAYFYAVHSGAELDLFLFHQGKRLGLEFKRQDAPNMTKSIQTSIRDLGLDAVWIIYPGQRDYEIADNVKVRSLSSLLDVRRNGIEIN